jgi:DMSO/TMAO reductase YedYZ molybdopterin-dependent catalytic subunit
VSDFLCFEDRSVLDCKWDRVKIKEFEELVKPRDVARAVNFDFADNYRASLFREELAGDDVLSVYKLNVEVLDEELAFLVRLIVTGKYAYKSALWVVRLGFTRGRIWGSGRSVVIVIKWMYGKTTVLTVNS